MRVIALAVVSAFAITPALAQWDPPNHSRSNPQPRATARVVESTPVYVAAREECWNPTLQDFEEVRSRDQALDRSYCRATAGEARLEGYDVRYRYGGRDYVARMAYDPGQTVRLGTDVTVDGIPIG